MNKLAIKIRNSKYAPAFLLLALYLLISFATRIALAIGFGKDIDASFSTLLLSFIIGWIYDLLTGLLIIVPFVLHIAFTNNYIYSKRGKYIGLLSFLILLVILLFTSIIPKDFSRALYKYTTIYVALRLIIFIFLYTRPYSLRLRWRTTVLSIFFFITLFLLIFNGVSEWFFWAEFASRYNFITVDYLIYTNEVIGNISESYPIPTILLVVGTVTGVIFIFTYGAIARSVSVPVSFKRRGLFASSLLFLILPGVCFLPTRWQYFSKNNYANELAGNGLYDFIQAFKNNELDFYTYYKSLSDSLSFQIVREQLQTPYSRFINPDLFDLQRQISYPGIEKKMNIVLISVESLSASFLQAFGNTTHNTPYLDSLATKGLLFTNLYASGTRTVRGLESLSLSLPPLPGQSIVKRPGNEHLFSLGSVLKNKGYTTQYIYGGYGYFDNMNYFFANNAYTVIDRTDIAEKNIHYANIWGVADEDLFTLGLQTMDKDYALHKPFFTHLMTVSNHRPYTYPAGRIDISPSAQSREGAVKYTDYAIGKFLQEAAQKPWFNNTVFIIVADHCASSAGKQALPLAGYHIPMIIYSPANIQPQTINALTAQIDIAPTILGILNLNYISKFLGQDVLHTPVNKQRAFISTYQGLGFIKNNTLIVQSPVKKVKAYIPGFEINDAKEIQVNDTLAKQAVAYYQVASWLIKYKKYTALTK